jgi:hypothetical protein
MGVVFIIKIKHMAVVKYGSIITQLKGKLDGHVFQRCGQSLSIRSISARKLTSSVAKSVSKKKMGFVASSWRSISASQKAAWSAAAPTYPTLDKYGNRIVLTGFQLFVFINKRYSLISPSYVSTASNYAPPAPNSVVIGPYVISTAHCDFWSYTPIAVNTLVLLYVSKLYPHQGLVAKPHLSFAGSIAFGTAIGYNLYSMVRAMFPIAPIAGNAFFWATVVIDLVTGQPINDNGGGIIVYS